MENIDKYLNEYKENINNFDKAQDILYNLYNYILKKSLSKFNNPTIAFFKVYDYIKPFRMNLLTYRDGWISKRAEGKILNALITDLKQKVKQLL